MSELLRAGMVGLDTSHCEAFCRVLHDETNDDHVPGVRVVRAFPGGTDLCALSRDRVGKYTAILANDFGVEIVDSIDALDDVDVFFLSSVDGRQHLEQLRALLQFNKPIFIDKPLTCSAADACELATHVAAHDARVMSASAVRFAAGLAHLRPTDGRVNACVAYGPAPLRDDYPGYFWYGVHSVDVLYSFMGVGCQRVHVTATDDADVIVGTWGDGRVGTVIGTRFAGGDFGCTVWTDAGIHHGFAENRPPCYTMLLRQIVPFFRGEESPVQFAETVEQMAFLDAAWTSRESGESVVL